MDGLIGFGVADTVARQDNVQALWPAVEEDIQNAQIADEGAPRLGVALRRELLDQIAYACRLQEIEIHVVPSVFPVQVSIGSRRAADRADEL